MQKITVLLSSLLITLLSAHAVKKIEANPINIAFMLAQDTDSASMASTCEYYGYVRQPSHEGYIIYKHRNSTIIRYSFKGASKNQPYPYVEVKAKVHSKDIDFTLNDLMFKKENGEYIRKLNQYARTIFTCKLGPRGFLIFHQARVLREEKSQY